MAKVLTKLNKITIKERIEHVQNNLNKLIDDLTYWHERSESDPDHYGQNYIDNARRRVNLTWEKIKSCKDELIELRKLLIKVKEYKLKKHSKVQCSVCNTVAKGVKVPESGTNLCYNCVYATVLEQQTKKDWVKQTDNEQVTKANKEQTERQILTPKQAAEEVGEILSGL